MLSSKFSAGAICSIAFGRCVPVLDGNVHRLLSRVLAVHSSPKARKTLDLLWKAAEDMVSGCNNPGDVNQALIELGSTVCKVKEPICETCPLKSGCGAYAEYTIVGYLPPISTVIITDIQNLWPGNILGSRDRPGRGRYRRFMPDM